MTIPKRFREDWRNRVACRFIVYFVIIITSITYFQKYFKIFIDASDSLPYSLYILRKGEKEAVRGGLYAFTIPGRSDYYYFPESKLKTTFGKKLIGLPGDSLQTDLTQRVITLKGEGLQESFKVLNKDSKGRVVTEIFSFNGKIPGNKYFLVGETANSYDSRYWGFVDEKDIIGRVYPVF